MTFTKVAEEMTGGCGCACHMGVGSRTSCEHCGPAEPLDHHGVDALEALCEAAEDKRTCSDKDQGRIELTCPQCQEHDTRKSWEALHIELPRCGYTTNDKGIQAARDYIALVRALVDAVMPCDAMNEDGSDCNEIAVAFWSDYDTWTWVCTEHDTTEYTLGNHRKVYTGGIKARAVLSQLAARRT